MRILITFILIASFVSIGYGFSIMEEDTITANKCIGFGTVGIFLVAMPLFLIKESRGKRMKDYMLTEENIKKMQERRDERPEDQ